MYCKTAQRFLASQQHHSLTKRDFLVKQSRVYSVGWLWKLQHRVKITEILTSHFLRRGIVGKFHRHKSIEYRQKGAGTDEHNNKGIPRSTTLALHHRTYCAAEFDTAVTVVGSSLWAGLNWKRNAAGFYTSCPRAWERMASSGDRVWTPIRTGSNRWKGPRGGDLRRPVVLSVQPMRECKWSVRLDWCW